MRLAISIALALSATAALADPLPQPKPPIVWPDRLDQWRGNCPVGWRASAAGDYCVRPSEGGAFQFMRIPKRYMIIAAR
jgi:hypothetical protein